VGGEQLTDAAIGSLGINGDRVVAVRDERDEITWAGAVPALMQVQAAALGAEAGRAAVLGAEAGGAAVLGAEAGVAAADLILPDGARVRTDAPDAATRLSAAVAAKVSLTPHRPDDPEAALHVLTTTTLRTLGQALPDSAVDASRFRPNLVLDDVPDDDRTGYPEHRWIGRRMAIGAVRLRFTRGCERCVVITKETPTVPHDREVLRWVARELGSTFGVYAAVETPGDVRIGDEARWLD
jgi:uncharacterized protein YcbX